MSELTLVDQPNSNSKIEQPIKRSGWLDLYPLNTEEEKILQEQFNELKERFAIMPTTAEMIRHLNKLASNAKNQRETIAWRKIKDWIFRQVLNDEAKSMLMNPTSVDQYVEQQKLQHRQSKGYDNWSGAQNGNYAKLITYIPEKLLDYSLTDEEKRDAEMFDKLEPPERPGNFENFITERLKQLLEIKKEPIVFVDFGGVKGITTLRLTHTFKNEVESGKMIFIVTNLSADKQAIEQLFKSEQYYLKNKWLQEAFQLTHYLQADATEIASTNIEINESNTIPLKNNIDFIHEANAISAHGLTNDKDFALLGQNLSDVGMLATSINGVNSLIGLSSEINTKIRKKQNSDFSLTPYEAKQLRAYKNLTEELGLVNVDAIPLDNGRAIRLTYSLFVKPTALELSVVDNYNHKHNIQLQKETRASKLDCYTSDEIYEAQR
ncbi:hypothetical protein KKI22_03165 [Patescibacteria group bacterium]|nr:hypothetical protein [Patescibacteria group bacterium]